jgi:hypothetical protein
MTTTLPVRPSAPHAPSADTPTARDGSTPETEIALAPATSAQPPTKDGVTIVVFSGESDRVQAAFNIAVGAASSGLPVTMFFTFWGLDVLTRGRLPDGPRPAAYRLPLAEAR